MTTTSNPAPDPKQGKQRTRSSLLGRSVLALVAAAALPLTISFYQLRTNKDALLDQIQRTHIVAAGASAARVDSFLIALRSLIESVARNPAVTAAPSSRAVSELLRGTLVARPEIAAVRIFDQEGTDVLTAQRSELREEIEPLLQVASAPASFRLVDGRSRPWIRLDVDLRESGTLMMIASTRPLDTLVQSFEMGDTARILLSDQSGQFTFGDQLSLDDFPPAAVEQAKSRHVLSSSRRFRQAGHEDLVIAHHALASVDWFVLSRQPSDDAELAQLRIRKAAWVAAGGSIVVTAFFAFGAYRTVIKPLRGLVAAQRRLAGGGFDASGSEIHQLESSFALLEQRIRDREALGQVFLGRYRVDEVEGTGAMGTVFRGWDPKLKRSVALKTVRFTDEVYDREKMQSSLLEEAAISASFHHPNIVTVYDVADYESVAFIAMEFIDGATLGHYLRSRRKLTADQVILIGLAVARALEAAHRRDLVHHDIKPANVLLGLDGSIKVTDFGISEVVTTALKSDAAICGTPGYLSPETLQGDSYDERSDLFALGVLLYQCANGSNPFFSRSPRETLLNTVVVEPKQLDLVDTTFPHELAILIDELLAKDPRDRPSSATEVVTRLEAMVRADQLEWSVDPQDLGSPARPDTTPQSQLIELPVTKV